MYATRSKTNKADDQDRRRDEAEQHPGVTDRPKSAGDNPKNTGGSGDRLEVPRTAAEAMASRTHILDLGQPTSPSEVDAEKQLTERDARPPPTTERAGTSGMNSGGARQAAPATAQQRAVPAGAVEGDTGGRAPAEQAPSVRSHASNVASVRRKEAELRALKRLATIEKQRLHREAELESNLVRKELEVDLEAISGEEDAESSRGSSRAATPPVVASASKVDNWLGDQERRKHSREEPPEPERRVRDPSPSRGHDRRAQLPADNRRVRTQTPPRGYDRAPSPIMPHVESTRGNCAFTEAWRRERSRSREPNEYRSSAEPPTSDAATAFNKLAEQLKETMRPRPPKQVYELPYYSGESSEWLLFYNSYRETTVRYHFSQYENMARLRNCLKGEARQCVQHLLATSSQPDLIIRLLKRNFGRTDLMIDKALEELKKLPHLGPSAMDLNAFSTKVINIVGTLVDIDRKNYADNPLLTREIIERLSPHLRSRWCQFARDQMGSQGVGELMLLANFLLEESEAELEYSHARTLPKRSVEKRTPQEPQRQNYGTVRRPPPMVKNERTYAIKTPPQEACLCCGDIHRSSECKRVKKMTVSQRWEWARDNQVCFRCMDKKHSRNKCKAKGCGVKGCPHLHHRLLHNFEPREPRVQHTEDKTSPPRPPRTPRRPRDESPASNDSRHEASESVNNVHSNGILLKVIPISIEGPLKRIDTFALMDEGSTVSLAEEELIEEIGATGTAVPLRLHGVGGLETSDAKSQRVSIKVRGRDDGPAHDVTIRTVKQLGIRGQRMNSDIFRLKHLRGLGDAGYHKAVPRILLGADNWPLMLPIEAKIGHQGEPAAVKTRLGWVIYGTVPRLCRRENVQDFSLHLHEQDRDLDAMLKNFFSIDSLGVKSVHKTRAVDQQAIDIFNATRRKIPGPRYEVGQLWNGTQDMPPSYNQALVRLRNLERKMDRDPEYAHKYTEQVENLLNKGYAERVEKPPTEGRIWYLPHFGVVNINKPGKLRLVFDAACTNQGKSLNDFLLEGPDLLQSLLGILFRFREGAYAVTADIAEMFLQVKIRSEDQATQLFLWRGADRIGAPKIFKMTSMIFGAASSPFLAHSVRDENARDNAQRFPGAVEDITTNHYMDDYVASYHDENELRDKATQVQQAHQAGGFELRGWSSNSDTLMKSIPSQLHASGLTPLGNKELKILGMYWNPDTDELGFNTDMLRVPAPVRDKHRPPTKREMLSAVMSIYDPLGLLSHYTITAKAQLQKIWAKKIDWDDPLPDAETEDFQDWLRALEGVAELRIPRCYGLTGAATRQLHIFVDASERAYACAAYWRTEDAGGIRVGLVAAKAKVAPIKQLTIPRMELQSALIGARLKKAIQDHHRVKINKTVMWSDSKTVLHWIRNDAKRYSTYVANRLGEIAEITDPSDWRWVPTKQNPADEATRPDKDRQVIFASRWYQGPEFLRAPEEEWPQEPTAGHIPEEAPEYEEKCLIAQEGKVNDAPLPELFRFSNYDRLINATGRVLQFIERLKTRAPVEFQVKHRRGAEHLWFQHAQRVDFAEELRSLKNGEPIAKKSRLFALDPVLDTDGLIRMRGRINAAPVQGLEKRPIILDGRNNFVRLLILRAHRQAAHANNERVVNDLRQLYWIIGLRPTVRAVANSCRLCQLRKAQPQVPAMGDLPLARIEPHKRPFTNTAVDLFGPLNVTIGRRHEKRWVALFTCLTTRAVHLEIVHSLSTDSAIMALRRLAARRGWPALMYSDNATNFRGSDQELRNAFREWLPALQQYGVQRHMVWRFIPPGAPNQGGAWERLVRSVKTALTATLHCKAPKEEVLNTLLTEAENCVNSRPLTHVSTDPDDEEALTPNHFLLGGSTGVPLTGTCNEADRRAWRASQALADYFWQRWVREYLPTLAPRQTSANQARPMQVGDCVIVVDPNLPRNVWPRGIIKAVYPGPDGGVRSADVRTKGGVFRRPVTKLAVLPVTSEQPR